MKFKVGDQVKFVYPEHEKEDVYCNEFHRDKEYFGTITEAYNKGESVETSPSSKERLHNDMYLVDWNDIEGNYLLWEEALEEQSD